MIDVTAGNFVGANPAAKVIYGRKLSRVRYLLNVLHREIFDYRHDIGRQDLPAGLLYLVDDLIDDRWVTVTN